MTEVAREPNCIEIVTPVIDRITGPDMPEVQMMGGIGSAALKHAGTEILVDERRIVTAPGFLADEASRADLAAIRPNGTVRDLDILLLTADEQQTSEIDAEVERALGGQLEHSVFNLRSAAQLDEQRAHPFGPQALMTFVSDRYLHEDGSMDKALFPFAVPLEPEVIESWKLEVGDREFNVPNPASTILNYLTRSVSGLRWKDAEKVEEMAGYTFEKAPELAEWIVDGPGQSQMELAGILQTLRRANSLPFSKRTLDVGGTLQIQAGSVRALADHEAFMLPDADANTRDAIFSLLIAKSRVLGIGESQGWIVAPYQRHIESRLDFITKNKGLGSRAATE